MNRLFILFASMALPNLVMADDVREVDDVLVTARPISSQSLEHITQPVTILTGEELERKQTNTIGETLANELGVTSSDFGQGASRPIIRGLGGPRLRILQNGLGSMDVSSISVDHNVSINPFQAEQIEIVRGPASLLYGNGNSAGLVNVVSNRIPDQILPFRAKFHAGYQSALDAGTGAFLIEGSPHENLAFHLDGLHFESENYEAEQGEILNSEIDTQDINIGGSFVGSRGSIGMSYGRYQSEYGIPFNPDEPDELVFIDLKQDRFDFAGELENPLPGFSLANLRVGYNDYTHTEFEGVGEPGTQFFNEEWETRLELAHNPIGVFNGAIGLQHRHRDFEAVGDEAFVPPVELYSIGGFIFEETDWNDFHFEFGARLEHQSADPVASSGLTDVDHDTYSVSFGTHWDFRPGYHLAFNTSRSQRAPSLEELFAGGPHLATETFEVGSVNLDEETSNNIDLSLANTDGNVTWTANLFLNYIEDFIFLQSQDINNDGEADEVDEDGNLGGELLSVRYQQDDAIFYGFEAETNIGLYQGIYGNLSTRLFTDYVRAEFTDGGNIPRVSPPRVGLGFEWSKQKWSSNLNFIHVFEQDDVAALETDTDGYVLLNAYVQYAVHKNGSVYFRGTNLLDEDARRHTSFIKERAPLPGQSFDVGVRLRF